MGCKDGTMLIWDLHTYSCINKMKCVSVPSSIAIHPSVSLSVFLLSQKADFIVRQMKGRLNHRRVNAFRSTDDDKSLL